ncbi:putative acyl-coenzyme A thioesterase 6, partial [Octodon degus]|uniref:Acyl-coenzyme A thioesterase 6 n=1 Tax=Octodon degus TaxID=10160 RepID=A0A6P3VDS6_OCTDE
GRLLASVEHERHFLAPGVRREAVRAGRVRGALFLPAGKDSFPGIIDLFGSSGGLCEYRASLLAGHGFAVLALAYFRFEDLPKYLSELHLEYFEEAVDFMLQHPKVRGPNLGLLGFSKGGDLCLSMASFLKGVTATVLINTCVANTLAPLHYKGMILPALHNDLGKQKVTASGLLDMVDIWDDPLEEPNRQSLIPLEKAQGPFLFFVGMDDHNWNSGFYAEIASARLQAHGKDKPQIIYYPKTGHCIDPPYFPPSRASVHALLGEAIYYGGEPRAQSRAQVDAWQQIQTFFQKHLNGKKYVKCSKI